MAFETVTQFVQKYIVPFPNEGKLIKICSLHNHFKMLKKIFFLTVYIYNILYTCIYEGMWGKWHLRFYIGGGSTVVVRGGVLNTSHRCVHVKIKR